MIIRIALLLIFVALPVFLSAELLQWMSIAYFAAPLSMLGSAMLLCGFVALAGAMLLNAGHATVRSVGNYFSSKQRAERRLWFAQARRDRVKRLLYFKTRQIKYFNELRRKRLLARNNRKHIRALSRAIDKDLALLKAKLPMVTYRQLRQDNIRYRKQQDIEALLQLQHKISTLV
ncbi:MAG: hypothetical protein ACXWF8_00995 [Methylobacter sp.]